MGKAQDVLMSLARNCVTKAQHFWACGEGSGAGWLQQPSFSVGCIPEEPRAGGSSQLAPGHGHSLAGLQVTPKAALCKQEISSSHWHSSEMRLGLDNGASRHPTSPRDNTPSSPSVTVFPVQRPGRPSKMQWRGKGPATESGGLGKIPLRSFAALQQCPGLRRHLTYPLSLLQGQVGGSQGLDGADDFLQLWVMEVVPDAAVKLLGFLPPQLREVLLLQRCLDLHGKRGRGDSGPALGHATTQATVWGPGSEPRGFVGARGDRTRGGRQGCPQSVTFIDRDISFQPTRQRLQPPLACGAPGEHPPRWPLRMFWRRLWGAVVRRGWGCWDRGVHATQAGCPGAPRLALAAARPQFQKEL